MSNVKQIMDISLVGVVSFENGQVHVILTSNLLGRIIGQAEIINDSKFKFGIWSIENTVEFRNLDKSVVKAFLEALKTIVESAVNHCISNPAHWVSTGGELGYDFLIPKDLLDKEALVLYERLNLKPRYPLFGSLKGH